MRTQFVGMVLFTYCSHLYADDLTFLFDQLNQLSDETKLSNSYNPTSLYVLYGEDLASLGIQRLDEALDFVPGIETIEGSSISRKVLVRGNGQPLSPFQEKIQFFVNGTELSLNYLPDFPISLIERIEIMKGSYFSGTSHKGLIATINIITKYNQNNENELDLSIGSFNAKSGSAIINRDFNEWSMSVDAYYLKHDKKVDAPSGEFAPQPLPIMINPNC